MEMWKSREFSTGMGCGKVEKLGVVFADREGFEGNVWWIWGVLRGEIWWGLSRLKEGVGGGFWGECFPNF